MELKAQAILPHRDNMKSINHNKGFTLIELLLVVAIIAILAIIVFVALNPIKRFQDTRTARRTADVETILTALHLYINDNVGGLPSGLSKGMAEVQLGTATTGCAISTAGCSVTNASCLDLSASMSAYLKSIPVDPSVATSSGKTGYSVIVDNNGIITVRACEAEGGSQILTSR